MLLMIIAMHSLAAGSEALTGRNGIIENLGEVKILHKC